MFLIPFILYCIIQICNILLIKSQLINRRERKGGGQERIFHTGLLISFLY